MPMLSFITRCMKYPDDKVILFNLYCANNLAGYCFPDRMKEYKRKGLRKAQETWKGVVSAKYEQCILEGETLGEMYQMLLMIQKVQVGRCYRHCRF